MSPARDTDDQLVEQIARAKARGQDDRAHQLAAELMIRIKARQRGKK